MNWSEQPAIIHAAYGNDLAQVRSLVEAKAKVVHSQDSIGRPPLFYAASYG